MKRIDERQHQQQQNDDQYPLDVENGYLLPEEKYIGLGNQDLNEEKNLLEAKDRLSYAHPKYEEKKGKINRIYKLNYITHLIYISNYCYYK